MNAYDTPSTAIPGVTARPAGRFADSWYYRRPYDRDAGYPFVEQSGYASNTERQVSEALASARLPAEMIRGIGPPLPQIRQFPPRYGYEHPPPTMEQILSFGRRYPDQRLATSGGFAQDGGYTSTSTPALNSWW